jgi:hypothetical protein
MCENFPNLRKEIDIKIEESESIPSRTKLKRPT